METRDPLIAKWANTIRVEEAPTAATPKTEPLTPSHKKTIPATVFLPWIPCSNEPVQPRAVCVGCRDLLGMFTSVESVGLRTA